MLHHQLLVLTNIALLCLCLQLQHTDQGRGSACHCGGESRHIKEELDIKVSDRICIYIYVILEGMQSERKLYIFIFNFLEAVGYIGTGCWYFFFSVELYIYMVGSCWLLQSIWKHLKIFISTSEAEGIGLSLLFVCPFLRKRDISKAKKKQKQGNQLNTFNFVWRASWHSLLEKLRVTGRGNYRHMKSVTELK